MLGIKQRCKATVRAMYDDAASWVLRTRDIEDTGERKQAHKYAQELAKYAKASESETKLSAMERLAQSAVAVLPDVFDRDPWLLNVQNGTLDLRTGVLSPHTRSQLITRYIDVPYDQEASCPLWEDFLDVIFCGNQDLISYVWKAIGYNLTGMIGEQCFFLLHGLGANGKSTFLSVLSGLMADYGSHTPFTTFLYKDRESSSNDLARLRGARVVTAQEMDQGKRLAEPLIKSITGGDKISCRFLYGEYFDFVPSFKLWLAANHKPIVTGTDHAIWRRIHLIPFSFTVPPEQQDSRLGDKLAAELPGILSWAVRGCLQWQASGLCPPASVVSATEEYRAEMDTLGAFLEECCLINQQAVVKSSALYNTYIGWCKQNGETELTQTAFGRQLTERGFVKERNKASRLWKGLSVNVMFEKVEQEEAWR